MLRRILVAACMACALGLGACIGDSDEVVDPDPPTRLVIQCASRISEPPTFARRWRCCRLRAMPRAGSWSSRGRTVVVFDNDDAVEDTTEFIDIADLVASDSDGSGSETGLLGMAFHPDFPTDPRVLPVYIDHSGRRRAGFAHQLNSTTDDDGETLDPDSEVVAAHRPAAREQSQRRQRRVRTRWDALHRPRRWRGRRRCSRRYR